MFGSKKKERKERKRELFEKILAAIAEANSEGFELFYNGEYVYSSSLKLKDGGELQ